MTSAAGRRTKASTLNGELPSREDEKNIAAVVQREEEEEERPLWAVQRVLPFLTLRTMSNPGHKDT